MNKHNFDRRLEQEEEFIEEDLAEIENDYFEEDEEIDESSDSGNETMQSIAGQFEELFMEEFERCEGKNDSPNLLEEKKSMDLKSSAQYLDQAVQDYKNQISDAFDFVYNFFQPKFNNVARKYNDEDLSQELSLVLMKALDTYNSNCGAKFNTYFWACARNHIGTLKHRRNAKKRTPKNGIVSMHQSFNTKDSEVEMESFIEDKDAEKTFDQTLMGLDIEKIFPQMKNDEVTACKMYMEGYTLEEIGEILNGISAPAVHVKLKRLANKKGIGKQLRSLYEAIGQ